MDFDLDEATKEKFMIIGGQQEVDVDTESPVFCFYLASNLGVSPGSYPIQLVFGDAEDYIPPPSIMVGVKDTRIELIIPSSI